MRLVLASGDGLNASSCDRLLARLGEHRARQAPELTIDLSKATYVDPYGAAVLALIARRIAEQGRHLICVLPSDRRTQQMSCALGLVEQLQPLVELRNFYTSQQTPRDSLLPLRRIRSRNDVQEVLSYLVRLARQHLDYDTGDVLDATKVVAELCYNVLDHSGVEGLAVARIASDRHGRRFISLAVVDAGCGIRTSLARRYPEAASWRHGEAIQRALGGLSSRESGGGMGLRSIHAIVRRYGGRLSIRSGCDRFYLAADRQPRVLAGVAFPGTQVGISFSQFLPAAR